VPSDRFPRQGLPAVPGPKNTVKQKPGRELLEFCRHREADVLRFASGTAVWPTNNISERGVRPRYIDTARKHGLSAPLSPGTAHARPPLDAPAQPISP